MATSDAAALRPETTEVVIRAARELYPHDALPDDVYRRVADKLAEAAAADPEQAKLIEDGAADLGDRDVAAIEGSPFFELVRSTAVVEVYSDERTWELLGYEGPSFDKGGYLERGFNDLDWLPDPTESA
jgi:hypothetical protein